MAGEPELFYIAKLLSTTTVTGGVSITDVRGHHRLLVFHTGARGRRRRSTAGVLLPRLTTGRSRSLTDGRPAGFVNRDDGTWRQLAVTDLDRTRPAARLPRGPCTAALLAWEAGVRDVEHEKPIIDVHRALDFLCLRSLGKLRRIQVNANGTWTAAQQIAWAYAR